LKPRLENHEIRLRGLPHDSAHTMRDTRPAAGVVEQKTINRSTVKPR
jgi:hypothetical protein